MPALSQVRKFNKKHDIQEIFLDFPLAQRVRFTAIGNRLGYLHG